MTNALLLVLAAYVAGATPSAFWIGRAFHGKDLRTLGSRNLGATNALRVLGWRAALPVMVADVFKGFAPVFWFPVLDGQTAAWWTVVYGTAAIVGHVFSFWVRFRGGKGVATSLGVLFAVAPVAGVAGIVVWLLALAISRTVSVASMAAALTVGVTGLFLPGIGLPGQVFLGFIAVFVIWAHRSNLRRLLAGEEPRIGRIRDNDGENG
ncbi:MAG: glycerol-3-phosphate 1-O-acyltransferase PlsY [Gemmatimonadota bacterium]|nr:glycerol-3-phosphate 1-O-acyltransferase PlsY [Gemmatimonadota bacterium]MDE2873458.1 glycerol-3-phosphate 1-O-acyltransferase PlsY [Gemmatimonadota bacterium]